MAITHPKNVALYPPAAAERANKRVKLLLDEESSSEGNSSDSSGGVALNPKPQKEDFTGFKINEDYARRFEHNQRRAEIHRLEDKYGKDSTKNGQNLSHKNGTEGLDGSASDSESESEDDEGILALGALDDQFNQTLQAIRNKDPRVYDEKTRFYTVEDEEGVTVTKKTRDKPMYLSDYHRENLLRNDAEGAENNAMVSTYAQEQDELKSAIVKEIHAAAKDDSSSDGSEGGGDDDNFLVKKELAPSERSMFKQKSKGVLPIDVENADKDPETFLSNFMSAKAWVPAGSVNYQPFESDDDEEDRRAEAFEEAYNLRFENPEVSNEKLLSHARDTAAKYSVRKETINSRKRARELENSKKAAERVDKEQEKARLRKLKIQDAEEKLGRIQDAAGLRGKKLDVNEWVDFLKEDWDDDRWEVEMNNKFGDDYYRDMEVDGSDEEDWPRKKLKKPKWEDDIDIKDLVPSFQEDEYDNAIALTDESGDERPAVDKNTTESQKGRRSIKQDRANQKREARIARRNIEQMVDEKLQIEFALSGSSTKISNAGRFRYRETSPTAYGLTAHDILMASDSQLNQFAGLKKLAPFRDPGKKKKDRKHLGKKARLRQWRKETFGDEQGSRKTLQDLLGEELTVNGPTGSNGQEPTYADKALDDAKGKKRKRAKKKLLGIET